MFIYRRIQWDIVFPGVDAVDQAQGEADADGERTGRAGGQRAVEVAAPVTQPVPGGIAGDQRQEQHVGHSHDFRVGDGNAIGVGVHRCIGPPGAELHRGIGLHDRRHGCPPASREQPGDQRPAIDFGADRPAEGEGSCRLRRQKTAERFEDACAGLLVDDRVERQPGGDFLAAQGRARLTEINGAICVGFGGLIAHGVIECLC